MLTGPVPATLVPIVRTRGPTTYAGGGVYWMNVDPITAYNLSRATHMPRTPPDAAPNTFSMPGTRWKYAAVLPPSGVDSGYKLISRLSAALVLRAT